MKIGKKEITIVFPRIVPKKVEKPIPVPPEWVRQPQKAPTKREEQK